MDCKKRGMQKGLKRWFCKDCKKSFSSNRRLEKLQNKIFKEYCQTLVQLSEKYHRSIPWIRKQINEYYSDEKVHKPRKINLDCDVP